MALWRKKFDPIIMKLGPVLIIFGLLQLMGVFNR